MHAIKYQDWLNPIKHWNTYGASTKYMNKIVVWVLSQVVNTSFVER